MIYVDSNALIYLLHDVKPKSDTISDILAQASQVYTSLRTIEEASYILIRINSTRQYNVKSIYQVRELVRTRGLGFVEKELVTLREMLKKNEIIVLQDKAEVEELHEAMARYKLLPGDAILPIN